MNTQEPGPVPAVLHYLIDDASEPSPKPETYGGDGLPTAPVTVPLHDARAIADGPRLAREGFTLLDRPSAVSILPSPEEIAQEYVPEVRRLLQELTGAAEVFAFAPGLRFTERSALSGSLPNSSPARQVHSDFAEAGSRAVVAKAFGDEATRGHWKAFNVWRVLTPPPQDTALAFCDMRSVSEADIVDVAATITLPDGHEETFDYCQYRFSAAHRWAFFPSMNRDEVVVFQGYDSRHPTARVAHCAFDDPTCPADAEARISIEVRAVALFAD